MTRFLVSLSIGGALLALASGCKKKEPPKKVEALAVQVMKIAPRSIVRVLSYDADIAGEDEVRVFAQVSERITSLPVDEGDQVKRGQTLAVLRADSLAGGVRSANAAVDAARADRDNLKDELGRAEKLAARNIVSRAQVDGLRARLLAAEAQIRRLEALSSQASTAKGYSVIRSPLDGIIGRRFLSVGDLASPVQPILTVVRMDRVEVVIEAPEEDLAAIRTGISAALTVSRHGERTFPGKVTLIAPTIDRQTRTARVKVELENKEHQLMPGMLARVNLEVERHDGVVVVPYSSVVIEAGEGGSVVYRTFVVEAGKARDRLLVLGIIAGDRVEVRQGLRPGDLLVTQGQHLLERDKPVTIEERLGPDGTKRQPPNEPERGSKPAGAAR